MTSEIDISQIRAVRNNNPGNIRIGDSWMGLVPIENMTPEQKTEHAFCVFQSPVYGFRAMTKILQSYQEDFSKEPEKYSFCIRDIISRWAPPEENKTQAYIDDVSEKTGFPEDQILEIDRQNVGALNKAISTHEVGVWIFNDEDLESGLTMAGL